MRKKYHVIGTEEIRLGRFGIRLDTVLENGVEYPYSYILLHDSVGILAFYQDKLILVLQYRHALESYALEIPGGAVEDGMSAEETARKELLEETGYIPYKMMFLGEYFPTPGVSAEKCSLFYAECKEYVQIDREPLEYMETMLVRPEELEKLITRGEFKHGMGLVAWLFYNKIKDKVLC